MFEKILNTFTKKTKKSRLKPKTKKGHYFFENKQQSLFKKRRRGVFANMKNSFSLPRQARQKTPLIISSIIITLWVILFLIFSSFLKISNIFIYREGSVINIDQAYGNVDYVRWKNILFLDTNEIVSRLQKSQRSISSIEFDVDFPNSLNIHIASYPAIFQTPEHLILSNGVVVSKDLKEYIWIPHIQTSENIDNYAIFWDTLNIADLKNLFNLIKYWKKNILGLDFKQIKYFIKEKELLLMHSSGTILIFDLSHDVTTQIEKLAIYEKEKGNIFDKKYIYIDVRIPEKLFLCSLEFEYDCRRNMKHIYGESIFEVFESESSELQQ